MNDHLVGRDALIAVQGTGIADRRCVSVRKIRHLVQLAGHDGSAPPMRFSG